MKRIVLLVIFALCLCLDGHTQGIVFESGSWEDAVLKAKTEHKIIFVDVYTQWCGPCKQVATKVFTQEKLGQAYNEHFINFKVDAESEFGKEFVKKYPVTGYPTFFYINADDGAVVYKLVGAHDMDGFLQAIKLLDMYAKYGGYEKMMEAIQAGKADSELLYDYYQSADKREKPKALNMYLKSLPTEKLVGVNNSLIEEISLYDKELFSRLIEDIVKVSNDGRFADGKYDAKFAKDIVFSVQYDLTKFFNESINKGDSLWFNELLGLKEKFANYGARHYIGGKLLDGDLNLMAGRGVFFATPEYLKLSFWAVNRVGKEEFKQALTIYMERLMAENHVDSLMKKDDNKYLELIKETGISNTGFKLLGDRILNSGSMACRSIILWTDYYWKLSPSNKKVRNQCTEWILYAFHLNPYNAQIGLYASDLLARIGNMKDAIAVVETAINSQKEIKNEKSKLFRNLNLKLADLKNGKI